MVFIDETWAKTHMTRTHGWQTKGEPLIDKVPQGHWKTLTFIAGLRNDGSSHHACSTDRSMARPSPPGSSSS
jgi:hypothetical protein